ncbi:hypothetical protein GCM10027258_40410 [Amycolatopsis stemonae]
MGGAAGLLAQAQLGPRGADQDRVAGVAWAQHTGIEQVEVRVDQGPWQETTLSHEVNLNTWRMWVDQVFCRATDKSATRRPTSARAPSPIARPAGTTSPSPPPGSFSRFTNPVPAGPRTTGNKRFSPNRQPQPRNQLE